MEGFINFMVEALGFQGFFDGIGIYEIQTSIYQCQELFIGHYLLNLQFEIKNKLSYLLQINKTLFSNNYKYHIMNWLSKKLLVSQLKKYFRIDSDKQINLQILGKRELTFENLILRNEIVNDDKKPIFVEECCIRKLEINYNSSKEQPISFKLDGAKVILKYNKNRVFGPSKSTETSKEISEFLKAIKSKDPYKKKSFLQEEFSQLINLIADFFIGKINLLITNIDISFQCDCNPDRQPRYIGVNFGEISIKQRMVVSSQVNFEQKIKDEEIHCSLQDVSIYLGIMVEKDVIEKEAQHREILRKEKNIKKHFILNHLLINIYYKTKISSVSIFIDSIAFNLSKLSLAELLEVIQEINDNFGERPNIRPGQGKLIQLPEELKVRRINGSLVPIPAQKIKMSQGSYRWWSFMLNEIMRRNELKNSFNIQYPRYRLYLYCLFYKFIVGRHDSVQKEINHYQNRKLQDPILKSYQLVLQKIKDIRQSIRQQDSLQFIYQLSKTKKVQTFIKANDLEELTKKNIMKEKVFVNFKNIDSFLREFNAKNQLMVQLNLEELRMSFEENEYDKYLRREAEKLGPTVFLLNKSNIKNTLYKEMIVRDDKHQSIAFSTLIVSKLTLAFNLSKKQIHVNILKVLMKGHDESSIVMIEKISFQKEHTLIEAENHEIVVNQKFQNFKIKSLFLNLERSFVQNFISLSMFMGQNELKEEDEEKNFEKFIDTNVYNKLPMHKILEPSRDSTSVYEIEKVLIVTSVFEDNRFLSAEINNFTYSMPLNQNQKISLQKITLSRHVIESSKQSLNIMFEIAETKREEIILENSRPFSGVFQNESLSENTKHSEIIEFMIPFFLLQISIQDILFLNIIMQNWKYLFENEFYFPKIRTKSYYERKFIELKPKKLNYIKQIDKEVVKSRKLKIQMEGFEIIVYGENNRLQENQLLSVLVDTIIFKKEQFVLKAEQEILIKNIFVKNCLGNGSFNKNRLAQIVNSKKSTNYRLIEPDVTQNKMSLIMYCQNDQKTVAHGNNFFMIASIKSSFNLNLLKRRQYINIEIEPFLIFHDPFYFLVLCKILSATSEAAKQRAKVNNLKAVFKTEAHLNEDYDVLESKDISQQTILKCTISKFSFIIVYQGKPTYTFALGDLEFLHQSEFYVFRLTIQIKQLQIVDVSQHCGAHPIIATSTLNISFISYGSEILMKKQNKSALLTLTFDNTKIYYLNRKIKEIVNFIMAHFEDKSNESESKADDSSESFYPFCYKVKLKRSKLILLRNSLSEESMPVEIELVNVSNYEEEGEKEEEITEIITKDSNELTQNEIEYESCCSIDESKIQFHSFREDNKKEKRLNTSKLYISVTDLQGFTRDITNNNPILKCLNLDITLQNSVLDLKICDRLVLHFSENDYRFLIRFTEENFGELPLIFNKNSVIPELNSRSFTSNYKIELLHFILRQKDQVIGKLVIEEIEGSNILFTNNSKQDQIKIKKLSYHTIEQIIGGEVQDSSKISQPHQEFINQNDPFTNAQLFPNIFQFKNHFSQREPVLSKDYEKQFKDDICKASLILKFFNNLYIDDEQCSIKKQTEVYLNQTDPGQKEETNLSKMSKWISGMCRKCLCCCKAQEAIKKEQSKAKERGGPPSERMEMEREKSLNETPVENYKNEWITQKQEMINFKSKIDEKKYQKLSDQSIYLHIIGEPWREKRMYMFIQKLWFLWEKDNHLMHLINYLNEPYSNFDQPHYVINAKFNNYPPFQMLIELKDSCAILAEKSQSEEPQINVNLDLKYNLQKVGDCKEGPGNYLTEVDLLFELIFKFENSIKAIIQLSDPLRLIHLKNQIISYKNKDPIHCNDRMLLLSGKSNQEVAKFYFPAFIIKKFNQLIKKIFPAEEKQEMKVEARNILKTAISRKVLIPKLLIEIQSKLNTSFINTELTNILYEGMQLNKQSECKDLKKSSTEIKKHNVAFAIGINYWNLSIGNFEPFLESWECLMESKCISKEDCQTTSLKIESGLKSEKEFDESHENQDTGLKINVSSAFFHTFKELELIYNTGDIEEQEYCFNLTQINPLVYEYMKRSIQYKALFNDAIVVQDFPDQLKNFFGRKFKIDTHNQNKKKSKKDKHKNKFHKPGAKLFLYHSFLGSIEKRKFITYRTPFRFFNFTEKQLELHFEWIMFPDKKILWTFYLNPREYYSIPGEIYERDFQVSILLGKALDYNKSKYEEIELNQKQNEKIQQQWCQEYFSVRYLIQMHGSKLQYKAMGKYQLYSKLFGSSNYQQRFIQPRDISITTQQSTFSLISIKSQSQIIKNDKANKQTKILVYDSLTVIVAPITIYNNSPIEFNLIFCRKKKIKLDPGEHIQLHQFPKGVCLQDAIIEFAEDIIHTEYEFFKNKLDVVEITMIIERMQSVNLKITKESVNTCMVQIFPDWIIKNQTSEELHISYADKEFPLDAKSVNCLAIQEFRTSKNNFIKIKIYDPVNPHENPHKIAVDNDTIDIFTLFKVEKEEFITQEKQIRKKAKFCSCVARRAEDETISQESKWKDSEVFKCIDFAMTIEEDPQNKLTKILRLKYRHLIKNLSQKSIKIYQSNSSIEHFNIISLMKGQQSYIYHYDFLPKEFLIELDHDGEKLNTNKFCIDDSLGRSISLKMKKNKILKDAQEYFRGFYHLRIDVEQRDYGTILNLSFLADDHNFPIYINNTTNYNVKISQNNESFRIKSNSKVPFSWSNLVQNSHEIEVEVEGVSQIYSLKQKTEFEPIIIMEDSLGEKLNKNMKKPTNLFKREECFIKFESYYGKYELILDLFSKTIVIHADDDQTLQINVEQAIKMVTTSQKLEISIQKRGILEITPPEHSLFDWIELFNYSMNSNISDKIFFTIESLDNSIIFFIHNLQIGNQNDFQVNRKEYSIEGLYISIILSSPIKPEEVLLIYGGGIQYIEEERICKVNQTKRVQDNFHIKRIEKCMRIKKFKINNQLTDALNPVILTQIKKSNFPFIQWRREKQQMTQGALNLKKQQLQQIEHYKSSIFFLDQFEVMIEAALIPKILSLKKNIDQIQNQYQSEKTESQAEKVSQEVVKNQQIYINFMEIKPLKMTLSVSFDANIDDSFEPKLMKFLTLIPSGIENAVIIVDSYMFHHVFTEEPLLRQTLKEYYMFEVKKQMLYNAGSLQIFTPIQLVQGLGIGVKSIFYNPFYQFVNTKEMSAVTSGCIEGIITFFVFMFTFVFKFISGIFKFISYFTFDKDFQAKREMFRRQIFKSPIEGVVHGSRYFWSIFKEFFINFVTLPCYYNDKICCFGLLVGFIFSILYIVLWAIKIGVTIYDFIYVVGLGFISWGYYEQNSMKYRSRPIRTFPHKQLVPYNYMFAKGNEIMRRNQIDDNDSEEIVFISNIQTDDEAKYLILSTYRILYSSHKLSTYNQIKLYKITRVDINPLQKKKGNQIIEAVQITIKLYLPNQAKILCCDYDVLDYTINLNSEELANKFISKLKEVVSLQKIKVDFPQSVMQNMRMEESN